jgi:hypothetical protein
MRKNGGGQFRAVIGWSTSSGKWWSISAENAIKCIENCNRISPMWSDLLATNRKKQREIAILESFYSSMKSD